MDFNVHHKDWLTFSGATDRPNELCYNFSTAFYFYFSVIFHRNHFFHFYQQNKSSESKVKFGQASNCCKRVLEAAKHTYATKTSPSLPRNLALRTFGVLLIVFSTKVNLLYLLYSTDCRCCLLHLIKQKYLLKAFQRTPILMTLISLYLFSFLELI